MKSRSSWKTRASAARSTDESNEKIGYKIREAQLEKVPYMVVVGDKDIENNTISIRKRKEGDLGAMTVEQFLEKIVPDRDNKVID